MTLQKSLPPALLELLPSPVEGPQVWLVGGAVRDHFLHRQSFDLDFVVAGDALRLARRIADALGGKYYDLDPERGAGRVLVPRSTGEEWVFDFTRMRGSSLQEDLGYRDFSINALAFDPHNLDILIDPTDGLNDLKDSLLRACKSDAIQSDPVRALRAVRIASELEFRIEPNTIQQIKEAGPLLAHISVERLRDEIFRMLDNHKPARSLRLLDHLGLFDMLFYEFCDHIGGESRIEDMRDIAQQAFAVISRLSELFQVLAPMHDPEAVADSTLGLVAIRLGRFREEMSDYLDEELSSGRTIKAWVLLGSLFSSYVNRDPCGDGDGSHDGLDRGSKTFVASAWLDRYHMSRKEKNWLDRFLIGHIPQLSEETSGDNDLQIYRYYQQTKDAGVGLVFCDLANFLAGTDGSPSEEQWESRVIIARQLLEAYFDRRDEIIDLEPLLAGEEIISEFKLKPGPMIGKFLQHLVELQVTGKLKTRDQALASVREMLAGGS
ncbi:MAG: CCA tRNA nucleotidyltransferase [Anaerolineales bacterium]|nr:MAG: CCA tRNA nucleotidyltransferase [Anaerolineales bacterium]